MIYELKDIKEVEITDAKEFKYYLLFVYTKNSDIYTRYWLINQSPKIEDLEYYKKTWKLGEGQEFRIFSATFPL